MSSEEERNLPKADATGDLPEIAGYAELLEDLKARIRDSQVRATLAVNRELLQLYWQIGHEIVLRQEAEGWGSSVIERLAEDLKRAFPDVTGFSASNIWRMRAFYLAYRQADENLAQPVREMAEGAIPPVVPSLPWGHPKITRALALSSASKRTVSS